MRNRTRSCVGGHCVQHADWRECWVCGPTAWGSRCCSPDEPQWGRGGPRQSQILGTGIPRHWLGTAKGGQSPVLSFQASSLGSSLMLPVSGRRDPWSPEESWKERLGPQKGLDCMHFHTIPNWSGRWGIPSCWRQCVLKVVNLELTVKGLLLLLEW